MSNLTDYAENKLCDFIRGQPLTLPSNWFAAIGSAAADGAFTELSGTGYSRKPVARSLAKWAGTQGPGSTLASSGTSHATSNNELIDFGTVGAGGWGDAAVIGLFDAGTGGNCWMWAEREAVTLSAGDPFSIAAGALAFTLGLTGGCTDYTANKLIDLLFRLQAFTWPASMWGRLFTAAPTNAGGGTEVAGASYARVQLPCTLTAICGTQGAGSTSASSGTSGKVSNNAQLDFPVPTEPWGVAAHGGWQDAAAGGNLLFWGALGQPKSIVAGNAPGFAPGAATFSFR